jgi:adenine phosphoribosyltransferase
MSKGGSVAIQLAAEPTLRSRIERSLRVVPDFPEPGILFQDITPLLADATLFADVVEAIAAPWRTDDVTHVAGIESRGFILAAPVALALRAGLIPIRKPGKLPSKSTALDYALEYGTGRLEMHLDACGPGSRVLIVDDVLATGGTASAACALVESVGSAVVGCSFLLTIAALDGAARLAARPLRSLVVR